MSKTRPHARVQAMNTFWRKRMDDVKALCGACLMPITQSKDFCCCFGELDKVVLIAFQEV
jgi:hypothetical protein